MRYRQHVNPLGPYFDEFRGQRPRLAEGAPVELEIGCADAQFLFERAAVEPQRTYIGLDIREQLVADVNRRASAENVPVQAVLCNANRHMTALFAARSVDRVYVNFPDPWFKRRHRQRRMVDRGLAQDIHRIASPGAEVLVQSDVWEIALDALEVFDGADELFDNQAGAWSFWKDGNPYGVRSWRESRCEADGLPIWRLWYRARPGEHQ
jgi:tRNA (guanine-N7-)-methyltransferase